MRNTVTRKELITKFRKLGFEGPVSGGKHQFMQKGTLKIRIPNPHKSKEIHIGLVKEILRQADISNEEFDGA